MLDWHSCQICYSLEVKLLLLILSLLFAQMRTRMRFRQPVLMRQGTIKHTYENILKPSFEYFLTRIPYVSLNGKDQVHVGTSSYSWGISPW